MASAPRVLDPPIRRTCRDCGGKLVLAVLADPPGVIEERMGCPGCGALVRPLTPSERDRVWELR